MRYISTRGQCPPVSGAEAILRGLAPDGGLYTPESIPLLPNDFCKRLSAMDYPQRTAFVLSLYLPEFNGLEEMARNAYARFDGTPAPLVKYGDGLPLFLELWHGPTCAFKDMALQLLPHLMQKAKELTGEQRETVLLTATSGDTGKAALEGFRDIPKTRVLVFYPEDGVSDIQKLQMVTQEGGNVGVCAVAGNFDDAQTGVKRVFSGFKNERVLLTSANSINLGRLLPQIVYYVSAYADYRQMNPNGGVLDVCVPTGNFGNILAAYLAKKMGVPLGRLICASNENNVLTNVIRDSVYNKKRPLVKTNSPSMDILVSSNFERALFLLSGGDSAYTKDCMERLNRDGEYALRGDVAEALLKYFSGDFCNDKTAGNCIQVLYKKTGRIIDPHTAVAAAVVDDREDVMVVSTAHPGKFPEAVSEALGGDFIKDIPAPLRGIEKRNRRFSDCVKPDEIELYVERWLG